MLDGWFMEAFDRQLVDLRRLQEGANQRLLAFLLNILSQNHGLPKCFRQQSHRYVPGL